MATVVQYDGDMIVRGEFRATGTVSVPGSSFGNRELDSSDPATVEKLQHQHQLSYSQADGTDVAAAIVPVYVVRGTTATILSIDVVCLDAPSGGDKTFTVDLKKSNVGSPSPATVLSAAVTYPNATPDCTVRPGTISSASLVDGDTLVIAVAVSGSTGTQGQGLVVTVTLKEDQA